VKIVSNKAKRILSDYLKDNDGDMLAMLTAIGEVLGKVDSIIYDDKPELLDRLQKLRN